jgi:16S rRNA (cytosine967-C5)-methyltransferase
MSSPAPPRQLALLTLRTIDHGAYADVAVDRALNQSTLSPLDKRLFTELVYGCVRRQRTLDALLDLLGRKPSHQQPPDLRLIMHLGLYQLRYLNQIPDSAAVNTTVDLAKQNGFTGLSGVVNGMLRRYIREMEQRSKDTADQEERRAHLALPAALSSQLLPLDPVQRLGILHSYPDWIVQTWVDQFGLETAEQLCEWMNRPPTIDLRVNRLKTTIAEVEAVLLESGVKTERVAGLPDALRLVEHTGAIAQLPGFAEGWWMVQDSSAQLVSYLLDPQPGETVMDMCAAPGGKTTHIAELMGDRGVIWACDKTLSRLKKVRQNCHRLGISSVRIHEGDSLTQSQFAKRGDRLLLDAPCSGLGTLHRHADARWRQTPDTIAGLAQLQSKLLNQAATWLKPGGTLVYATCTLNPPENEQIITQFLETHANWAIAPPPVDSPLAPFVTPQGWLQLLPHQHSMDGFFMTRLTNLLN